jgi:uncharacterized protein (UPF0210 family)
MPYIFSPREIMETIRMIEDEKLDIRTITMGISLLDCRDEDADRFCNKVYEKIQRLAGRLVQVGESIEQHYGIPIIHKRISVTPMSIAGAGLSRDGFIRAARILDKVASEVGVNFIGGYSALVHKGMTSSEKVFIESIPEALASTERVCSSVNVGTSKAGINMDAVREMGYVVKETARLTADRDAIGCAKLVVFCNVPEDNPFMAGAFHGVGEPEAVINVGVSGPGVILSALKKAGPLPFGEMADRIKRTAFKITRMGEMVGRQASSELGIPFGIVDLSLAPTPALGDSVAEILEAIGVEKCGAHGTTAALAILNDAVKKGGSMASSYVGGLSGAFIPVSEDAGMIKAVEAGALSIEKLEAMTCVCSVGLDMIAVPGDVPAATISAIIADEAAIGMINRKTTAVRLIPVPGKKVGDHVEFGGLLGEAPIMSVNEFSSEALISRGGRIPAPITALNN